MDKMLIVVDMLNDFCHKDGVLATSHINGEFYAKPIIENVKARINEHRIEDNPVVWLYDAHDENDKEFDRFPKHAVKGSWGSEVLEELRPFARENGREVFINKTRYSGFYGTDLNEWLETIGKDVEVEVVGVCTSICVMDTVGGLANRDYSVTIVKDAVADFDPEAHESALKRMEGLYGAKIV